MLETPQVDTGSEPEVSTRRNTSTIEAFAITVLFAVALAAFAFAPTGLPDSYSWVEHGISESAAQGIEGAWPARGGLLLYGLAALWLAVRGAPSWPPLARGLHILFGASMLGVAAFSARPWIDDAPFVDIEDQLHSVFAASAGFAFVTALVTLVVVRRQRSARAAIPDWCALIVTALVPLSASSEVWGLLQRGMFVVAASWFVSEAWRREHPD